MSDSPETHDDQARWVERLRSPGAEQDAALEELRGVLTRGLSRSLAQRGGGPAFAEDVAQEALLKILKGLDGFSGRSKFTTWAMTIATRIAISSLRRKKFQDVSLEQVVGEDALRMEVAAEEQPSHEDADERKRIVGRLREAIDDQLSERQREAIHALLSGMAVEVIAEKTGSNRNAVYKLFHDARQKLRKGLEASGVTAEEVGAVLA